MNGDGGWILVPSECTHAMELALSDALSSGDYSIGECLDRAIAAAPKPEAQAAGVDGMLEVVAKYVGRTSNIFGYIRDDLKGTFKTALSATASPAAQQPRSLLMDERRCLEVLSRILRCDARLRAAGRAYFTNDEVAALDNAIATIERVAGAPAAVAAESAGRFYYVAGHDPIEHGQRVRLVPDPQPDGQEG